MRTGTLVGLADTTGTGTLVRLADTTGTGTLVRLADTTGTGTLVRLADTTGTGTHVGLAGTICALQHVPCNNMCSAPRALQHVPCTTSQQHVPCIMCPAACALQCIQGKTHVRIPWVKLRMPRQSLLAINNKYLRE